MNKNTLLACFLVFCFQFGYGQRFQAGLIGGLSTSQVSGDQLSGFNQAGLIAGGFVNSPVSDKSSLQMEIIFIQKGSRKPVQPNSNNEYYILRLSYIEVPLLYKWKASSKFTVEGGFSFGALVFSQEETEQGVYESDPPFRTYEISINVGLNYPLSENLFVNARYSNSIVPIRPFEQNYLDPFFNKGQYNTVVAFSIHYQF